MISFKENVGSANEHKMHMRLTDRSDHQIWGIYYGGRAGFQKNSFWKFKYFLNIKFEIFSALPLPPKTIPSKTFLCNLTGQFNSFGFSKLIFLIISTLFNVFIFISDRLYIYDIFLRENSIVKLLPKHLKQHQITSQIITTKAYFPSK